MLDAPRRAEDAAIVPIGMRVNFAGDDKRTLKSLTLVIDENPAPVAGTFTIGPHSGVTSISTRVRVNSYSYVRLIAELSDGKLYGVKTFVKASGGCSAPAALERRCDQIDARADEIPHVPPGSQRRRRRPRSCCVIRRIPACRWIS